MHLALKEEKAVHAPADLHEFPRSGVQTDRHLETKRAAAGRAVEGGVKNVLADFSAALLITAPAAPIVAALLTMVMYSEPLDPLGLSRTWLAHPATAAAINLVVGWLVIAIPSTALHLSNAEHVHPSSFSALGSRLIELGVWCSRANAWAGQAPVRGRGVQPQSGSAERVDVAWQEMCALVAAIEQGLRKRSTAWVLGSGYIALWRRVHHAERLLVLFEPKERVLARAVDTRSRLAGSTIVNAQTHDTVLRNAIAVLCTQDGPIRQSLEDENAALGGPRALAEDSRTNAEREARISVGQIHYWLHDFRTDRWNQLARARNQLTGAMGLTGLALYALFWLATISRVDAQTIRAATAFYLVGAIVGLFNLLYTQAGVDSAVDDYGLSIARLVAVPQLSGIAAVMGVVSITMVSATQVQVNLLESFDLIRQPLNIITAAAFAFSPGLALDRLRRRTEDFKGDLRTSRSAESPA